mmetsp:Transcript_16978/g.25444  ORF Transcript_16978/g.25444 Transcript_16978/m.25444 type:complete len:369 (-) Transcript_16978:212-1318(-)
MESGVEYTFIQSDPTNWFHPLGFAYFADGAHVGVDELEPGLSPDTPGAACVNNKSCQHPEYFVGNHSLGSTTDTEDFGLDVYEPWFQRSQEDWLANQEDGGSYNVKLIITDANTAELFYFCHVHGKMSGYILVQDGEGAGGILRGTGEPTIPLGYEPQVPSAWDKTCGTYDAYRFSAGADMEKYCPGKTMICKDKTTKDSTYADCVEAIDCKMMWEMSVQFDESDPITTFCHQMIPHHVNAILMAKVLLKDADASLPDDMRAMLIDIINGQNTQIMIMNNYLASKANKAEYPAYEKRYECETTAPSNSDKLSLQGWRLRWTIGGVVFGAVWFACIAVLAYLFKKVSSKSLVPVLNAEKPTNPIEEGGP